MEEEAERAAKIRLLRTEVDLIHHANILFWRNTGARTRAASIDYYLRQERLEEIRRDFIAATQAAETD